MNPLPPESRDRLPVEISRDLEDIVPIFLANRKKDLLTLRVALTEQDFRTIQNLGHRMKGDGGGFGFDRISEIGAALELAAQRHDRSIVDQHIAQLEDFLHRVTITYR
ncbi:MAG: Hpt domain-containing protein [Nitrospira sp.]